MSSITQSEWELFTRIQQVDYIIENKLFDSMYVSINEIKSWCERHAFEKDYRDAIFGRALHWRFSFTGRWVHALMAMWYLHDVKKMEYCHYRRDIMPTINKEFKKNYDITNLATLGRKPYELIEAADKVRLGDDYDCDGMWKLSPKAYDVLDLKKKTQVPKTVLFSTLNENLYKIVGDKMIYWNEAPSLNLKETLEILKTW